MKVGLRLVLSHNITSTEVNAPCKGVVAKTEAKDKLEKAISMGVKFVSYQEKKDAIARSLGDDENVLRGSILNYSVSLDQLVEKVKGHDNLLGYLMKDRVRGVIAKFCSRFFRAPESKDDIKFKSSCRKLIEDNPDLKAAVGAALTTVASQITPTEFADSLDESYHDRNLSVHVNTNVQLAKELEELRRAGAHNLLRGDLPAICLVIEHYEVFLQLLP